MSLPTSTKRKHDETKSLTPKKHRGKQKLPGFNTYSIKQGLSNILKLNQLLPMIEDLVHSVSLWSYHTYNLLHIHAQRLLDLYQPVNIHQTLVNQAFALVTSKSNDSKIDLELKTTHDTMYKNLLPDVKVPLERSGAAVFACLSETRDFMTAAKNNISVHFYKRHSKWIRLMLIQYYWHRNKNVPKKLGKQVYSLYKVSIAKDDPSMDDILPESDDEKLQDYCFHFIEESRTIINLNHNTSRFPITNAVLQKRWSEYLPWMRRIITDFKDWQTIIKAEFEAKLIDTKQRNRMLKGFKLFAIMPQARIGLRHIMIDNRVLYTWMKKIGVDSLPKTETKFIEEQKKWWNIAFKSHDGKRMANHTIKTDGVAASIIYLRKDPNYDPTKAKVKPKVKSRKKSKFVEEFTEVKFVKPVGLPADVPIIGLDPGKRDIFATSSGEGMKRDRIRSRMSGTEYRISSGEVSRRKKAAVWNKELKKIIPNYNVVTHKVASTLELITGHFQSIATDFRTVWEFRCRKRQRRMKFDEYIRSNKAIDRACQRIIKATKTKQKVVIAFGQARFHGTKGCPTAPTKRLHHRLSLVHKERCWVIDTDEYGTSKLCPRCGDKLFNVNGERGDIQWKINANGKEKKEMYGEVIYSLKACQKCFIVCDRDIDIGAYNIYNACKSMLSTGERPKYLRHREGGIGDLETVHRRFNLNRE